MKTPSAVFAFVIIMSMCGCGADLPSVIEKDWERYDGVCLSAEFPHDPDRVGTTDNSSDSMAAKSGSSEFHLSCDKQFSGSELIVEGTLMTLREEHGDDLSEGTTMIDGVEGLLLEYSDEKGRSIRQVLVTNQGYNVSALTGDASKEQSDRFFKSIRWKSFSRTVVP